MNVLRRIQAYNEGRDPERLALKYAAMRRSPFAFLRGSCHLFYAWLPRSGIFKSAPLVWLCGDLHLENFGSYKADNRLVYFDINDFDEAALAPASWDLVRMLASLRVGADALHIDPNEATQLCNRFVEVYASSLAHAKAYWVERDTAQGLVRALLDGLRERRRAAFLDTRTVRRGKERVLRVDGEKALPASAGQRARVIAFMRAFARTQPDPGFYRVIDVARRIAGTGSLGVDRFVILVRGRSSPDANYLLDLKQALPSALSPFLKVAQPAWRSEAERVVAVQARVQAVPASFLHAVVFDGAPYVLRGLQRSEDRVALGRSGPSKRKPAEVRQVIETMARIVAWSQLRSAGREGSAIADELVDFSQRLKWKRKLLAASEECARQVQLDAASFNAAYDAGAFDPSTVATAPATATATATRSARKRARRASR
jgi:uncharacterized protein (DUF2252 family)